MNVDAAPIVLMTIDRATLLPPSSPLCFSFSQWRTIPVCDSVNDVNTPTTYSWINRLRSASNAMISRLANAPSTITPFENTSRSPRLANCRGMNRSRARIDESRGKSW